MRHLVRIPISPSTTLFMKLLRARPYTVLAAQAVKIEDLTGGLSVQPAL